MDHLLAAENRTFSANFFTGCHAKIYLSSFLLLSLIAAASPAQLQEERRLFSIEESQIISQITQFRVRFAKLNDQQKKNAEAYVSNIIRSRPRSFVHIVALDALLRLDRLEALAVGPEESAFLKLARSAGAEIEDVRQSINSLGREREVQFLEEWAASRWGMIGSNSRQDYLEWLAAQREFEKDVINATVKMSDSDRIDFYFSVIESFEPSAKYVQSYEVALAELADEFLLSPESVRQRVANLLEASAKNFKETGDPKSRTLTGIAVRLICATGDPALRDTLDQANAVLEPYLQAEARSCKEWLEANLPFPVRYLRLKMLFMQSFPAGLVTTPDMEKAASRLNRLQAALGDFGSSMGFYPKSLALLEKREVDAGRAFDSAIRFDPMSSREAEFLYESDGASFVLRSDWPIDIESQKFLTRRADLGLSPSVVSQNQKRFGEASFLDKSFGSESESKVAALPSPEVFAKLQMIEALIWLHASAHGDRPPKDLAELMGGKPRYLNAIRDESQLPYVREALDAGKLVPPKGWEWHYEVSPDRKTYLLGLKNPETGALDTENAPLVSSKRRLGDYYVLPGEDAAETVRQFRAPAH